MPTVDVHPPIEGRTVASSGLPKLLQTPLGIAILELQGTINFPQPESGNQLSTISVGNLVFPDYKTSIGAQDENWTNKVLFYVGHQRMNGEMKKLAKPLGVLRRLPDGDSRKESRLLRGTCESHTDTLEILEVIRWKLVFSSRPEPVGMAGAP